MSWQSANDLISGPTSSRIQRLPDESAWKHLCTNLMRTTFVYLCGWILNKFQSQVMSLDHQMGFQILSHTVGFCLPVCLVCFANNRSLPSLHSTTSRKDPTEPELQRCLLLLYGLRFRQFRWLLTGMGLTGCDSKQKSSQAENSRKLSV